MHKAAAALPGRCERPSEHLEDLEPHGARLARAAGDGEDPVHPGERRGRGLEADHGAEVVARRIDRLAAPERRDHLRRSVAQALAAHEHALAMIILTVPIIFPVIKALGFDPIWFGVIIVMTVELGLIHPPVGMNVFVIKSVVHDVSFSTIFKGVLPFIVTDLIRLVILIAFPIIALWLPTRMG